MSQRAMSPIKSLVITLPTGKGGVGGVGCGGGGGGGCCGPVLVDGIKLEADGLIFNQESSHEDAVILAARGKKRRLDHLTWEEKLQRKKLKNRVAAQTSRDRKKAKLDELEETVRLLKEKNDILIDECSMLRTQNELLVSETKMLKRDKESSGEGSAKQVCSMCQASVGCTVPTLGSAVSPLNPLQQGGTAQSAQSLMQKPSTTILMKILTLYLLSKIYLMDSKQTITSTDSKSLQKAFCERLPQKWKQALLNQMNSPVEEESASEKFDHSEEMVGQASGYVEAGTPCRGVTTTGNLVEALVGLPDGMAAIPIIPRISGQGGTPMAVAIAEELDIKQEPIHEAEMVYGTYDEATNCITIIYPEEEEVSSQIVGSPAHSYESMSPASVRSEDTETTETTETTEELGALTLGKFDCLQSDGGYESHGSPASSVGGIGNNTLTSLWHESFSELFPSLA